MTTEDTSLYKYNSTFKLRFYDKDYAFINISPDIIKKLGLTEGDSITEELTNEGHIILKRKETA